MTRWNIATIFFLGVSGRRRDVTLAPDALNIITGASGTGKSTLIKAIDYCLGSSKCELPAHVRRRSVAVGVKWVAGDAEMIVGRVIPPVGQATSTRMFTAAGRNLPLPETIDGFDGATTLEAAKAFIERAFGIGDVLGEPDAAGGRGRATVRHVTPYAELRRVDDQIQTWLRQSEETRRLADLGQLRAHLLGRISFFLEASVDEPRQASRDLNVLRAEIAELEARVDREAKEIKLRRAEAKISQFASEAFAALPTVAPCIGSELDFSSRQPEVTVIEAESGAVLRLPDVGSDQNYLAIHIALSFALQRYFEVVNAPVPGLLVLDQISRPYFPTSGAPEVSMSLYDVAADATP